MKQPRTKRRKGKIMKRKLLEDMGLTKEQVDQIMEENGKDITREQNIADKYKKDLEDVQEKLKSFDGVNPEELNGKITSLTADLENTKKSYESQIESMRFNTNLESRINAMKPKSAKAVMAFLDVDALMKSKNQDADIDKALETVKKEQNYLFDSDASARRVVSGTDTTGTDNSDRKAAANEAFRSLMRNE